MIDLSPNATATHWAAPWVGRPWSETFNCWHLVQEVQRVVFGRSLADLPIGAEEDQTAALLNITTRWSRAEWPALDGDILTMLGPDGQHVGVVAANKVLHNVGGRRDGYLWGSVRLDRVGELGRMGYGHLKLWRAT